MRIENIYLIKAVDAQNNVLYWDGSGFSASFRKALGMEKIIAHATAWPALTNKTSMQITIVEMIQEIAERIII